MTLSQLNYIVAVANHLNFGAAAASCFVTQPTLSMQVQKLEEELNLEIFDRSQIPIRMTPIGEQLVAQARIALAEAQKILDLSNQENNQVAGSIAIGVIPTLSPYMLPLFIQTFSERYPETMITIEELQTHQIIEGLRNDRLDIGILVTPLNISNLVEHPLFYEPFLLYVSPQHPLANEKKIHERDLSSTDIWLLTEGHCFRDQVLNLCKEKRGKLNRNLRFESGNLETLKKMVDQTHGYTLLPALAADDIEASKKKKQIREFHAPVPTREISLVHNKVYRRRAVTEALIKEIKAAIPSTLQKFKSGQQLKVDMPKFES